MPWIEKYRPNTLDDIILDNTNLRRINYISGNNIMPNIIIAGEPGIGKTTTILCIAKKLLGKKYKDFVLELNASDNRGIKTVQECMTRFCKKKLDKNISHKIILLDEADNLTPKAQQLIATLMEKFSDTTKFAFTCNNIVDIIDSIQSRCTILKYTRLSPSKIKKKVLQICEKENIKYDSEGLNAIIINSNGDLRNAINNLQSIYTGFGELTLENFKKICDKPNPFIIKKLIEEIKNKNINKCIKMINKLKKKGYPSCDILLSINNVLKLYNNISEDSKMKYIYEIGKTYMIINKGVDTDLQIYGCLARVMTI
jgi:replication factor C subunit 2/4